MRLGHVLAAIAVICAGSFAVNCYAQDTQPAAEELKALRQKINELEQKLQKLEKQQPASAETDVAPVPKSKPAPTVVVDSGGLTARSADSNFVTRLRGYIQADARFYPVGVAHDTFLMRRIRPILEGTVYEKFDYKLMLDFGQGAVSGSTVENQTVVQDAYINARLLPEFQIQAGKFTEPVSLEWLQSATRLWLVERAYPSQLLPNRDVGLQFQGGFFSNSLNYAVGVFNGSPDGGSTDFEISDSDKDFSGRVFTHPFRNSEVKQLAGLGFGVAGTYGRQKGILRGYLSVGQERFFEYYRGSGTDADSPNVRDDGDRWRVTPQGYYFLGPWGLMAEYAISHHELRRDSGGPPVYGHVQNDAWQVATSFVLTGEDNSWEGVSPRNAFSLGGGGWGALEVVARVTQLAVDSRAFPTFADPGTSAHRATSWGTGLNWYLNKNVKLTADYEQTYFDGGQNATLNNEGEKAIFSRVQFAF